MDALKTLTSPPRPESMPDTSVHNNNYQGAIIQHSVSYSELNTPRRNSRPNQSWCVVTRCKSVVGRMNCTDCTKDLTHETIYIWKGKPRCEDCNENMSDDEFYDS